ncbi:exported hypothetical protein [uncultured Defluviicoccus sp.]|uniref:Uncharacterized protein n=1 Tax=metagenome TaxID=256318 RepID=A0A380TJD0_9ZZZZ|nr:exported hypothetical protein [uncultured Defluviicoccus sp.]
MASLPNKAGAALLRPELGAATPVASIMMPQPASAAECLKRRKAARGACPDPNSDSRPNGHAARWASRYQVIFPMQLLIKLIKSHYRTN